MFQKKKEKSKHFTTTYLSNYLNTMKQKTKNFEDSIIKKKRDH
jgi:hypothetical protein